MDEASTEFKFAIALSPLAQNCQEQGIGSTSAPGSQGTGQEFC